MLFLDSMGGGAWPFLASGVSSLRGGAVRAFREVCGHCQVRAPHRATYRLEPRLAGAERRKDRSVSISWVRFFIFGTT